LKVGYTIHSYLYNWGDPTIAIDGPIEFEKGLVHD
jgi:hypothetical protein